MQNWQERTSMLLGQEALETLSLSRIAVVGTGGVGAVAAEMLVRAGVGHIALIDSDSISESNLNRQIPALLSTVGRMKCDVLRERFLDINPSLDITVIPEYVSEQNVAGILGPYAPDVVVDAIDTLSPKIALIQWCLGNGVRLVSSMGSGAKLDVTRIRIADISATRMCPLAHMLRKRLHHLGISTGFTAVYSEEPPRRESVTLEESKNKKSQVGSVSYLPAAFGCACAQAALGTLI